MYHFHISAAIVLVVEYLMWRQQFFLELLYCHALVCLLAVLIFFFGVFWKIVFASKSLFFYLGLGMVSWVAMITTTFFTCDYGPRHGPQTQYKRWMYINGLYDPTYIKIIYSVLKYIYNNLSLEISNTIEIKILTIINNLKQLKIH